MSEKVLGAWNAHHLQRVSTETFAANRDPPAEIITVLQKFLQADVNGSDPRPSVRHLLSATADSAVSGAVNAGTDVLTVGNFRIPVNLGDLEASVPSNLEAVAFNGPCSKTVELEAFTGVALLGRGNDTVTSSVLTGDVAVDAGDGRDTLTAGSVGLNADQKKTLA